jgi:hypothetical protein
MLSLFRMLLTGALLYGLMQAAKNAAENPQTGDLMNAFWLAYCVIVGIFAALAWAPLIGSRIADPATGILTNSTYVERPNWLMKCVRRLEGRRCRRLVRWLCFVEGVRHPWLPAQFITGLNHARPGSWLELAFAREVYRFNHIQNCMQAFGVLRRRGLMPRPHANTEINLVLMSLEKAAKPEAPILSVPTSTPPPLKRNPRIKLFENGPPPPPAPTPAAPSSPTSGLPEGPTSDPRPDPP